MNHQAQRVRATAGGGGGGSMLPQKMFMIFDALKCYTKCYDEKKIIIFLAKMFTIKIDCQTSLTQTPNGQKYNLNLTLLPPPQLFKDIKKEQIPKDK